ncbi:Nuclear control of ATPase protein 2 [Gonapodya sp. JEL0774]|nr:Nuclear control of ATPase protein 2 [Gonapodya sp. JEL0774]
MASDAEKKKKKKESKEKDAADSETLVTEEVAKAPKEKSKKDKKVKEKPQSEGGGDAMDVDGEGASKKAVSKDRDEEEGPSYESRVLAVNAIASPLASKKLTKKLYKTIKKASKAKSIKRGVKEVVKGLRKGSKGVVLIAGDISPIDVITHVPILCEEANVPYCYVPSKEDLGHAGSTKRPTSCIMVMRKADADFVEAYDEIHKEIVQIFRIYDIIPPMNPSLGRVHESSLWISAPQHDGDLDALPNPPIQYFSAHRLFSQYATSDETKAGTRSKPKFRLGPKDLHSLLHIIQRYDSSCTGGLDFEDFTDFVADYEVTLRERQSSAREHYRAQLELSDTRSGGGDTEVGFAARDFLNFYPTEEDYLEALSLNDTEAYFARVDTLTSEVLRRGVIDDINILRRKIVVRIFGAKGLDNHTRIKVRPGIGIECKSIDPFVRVTFAGTTQETTALIGSTSPQWDQDLAFSIFIPPGELHDIQQWVERQSFEFALFDYVALSQVPHVELVAIASVPLIRILLVSHHSLALVLKMHTLNDAINHLEPIELEVSLADATLERYAWSKLVDAFERPEQGARFQKAGERGFAFERIETLFNHHNIYFNIQKSGIFLRLFMEPERPRVLVTFSLNAPDDLISSPLPIVASPYIADESFQRDFSAYLQSQLGDLERAANKAARRKPPLNPTSLSVPDALSAATSLELFEDIKMGTLLRTPPGRMSHVFYCRQNRFDGFDELAQDLVETGILDCSAPGTTYALAAKFFPSLWAHEISQTLIDGGDEENLDIGDDLRVVLVALSHPVFAPGKKNGAIRLTGRLSKDDSTLCQLSHLVVDVERTIHPLSSHSDVQSLVLTDAQWVFLARVSVLVYGIVLNDALVEAGDISLQLGIDFWRQVEFGSFNTWFYFAQIASTITHAFSTQTRAIPYVSRFANVIEALALPISQLHGEARIRKSIAGFSPLSIVGSLKSRLHHEIRSRRRALEALKSSRQETLGVLSARGLLALNAVTKGRSPSKELLEVEGPEPKHVYELEPLNGGETSQKTLQNRIDDTQCGVSDALRFLRAMLTREAAFEKRIVDAATQDGSVDAMCTPNLKELAAIVKGQFASTFSLQGAFDELKSLISLLSSHAHVSAANVAHFERPSAVTRYWLPGLAGSYAIVVVFQGLKFRWNEIIEIVENAVATVNDFWRQWVVEPIKTVYQTVRNDPEAQISLLKLESLQSDLSSLERMVIDFVRDTRKSNPPSELEMKQIADLTRKGDLTPVLEVYEADMKNPIRGALHGQLLRSVLIQVQKVKVDTETAMNAISKLLSQNELNFAVISSIPALLAIYALWTSFREAQRSRGILNRDKSFGEFRLCLRRLEVILNRNNNPERIRAMETADPFGGRLTAGMGYRDHGAMLCELYGLRRYVKYLPLDPADVETILSEDLADLNDARLTISQKLKTIDRIWQTIREPRSN